MKKILLTLLAALTLSSCGMFGGYTPEPTNEPTSSKEPTNVDPNALSLRKLNKYKGHYLVDLYDNLDEREDEFGRIVEATDHVWIHKQEEEPEYFEDNDSPRRIGGEYYSKGFRFTPYQTQEEDAFITYKIEPGKYRSLCFALGIINKLLANHASMLDRQVISFYLDGVKVHEELIKAMDPVKWLSLDITNKSLLEFRASYRYDCDALGMFEVTLWEDANHKIEESQPKAKEAENFDDVLPIINNFPAIEDCRLKDADKVITMNGKKYNSGFWFSPIQDIEDALENPFKAQRITFNTFGRYKYMKFLLGHIDSSNRTGAIILRVIAGEKVIEQVNMKEDETPKEIVVEINYAHYITFAVCANYSVDHSAIGAVSHYGLVNIMGHVDKPAEDSDAHKFSEGSYRAFSEVGRPYSVVNAFDVTQSVFTNESKFYGVQVGGIIYNEGILMKSIFNMATSTVDQIPASFNMNLYNQFKYMTFKVGRRDRTALVTDRLNVYVDGNKVNTFELNSLGSILEVQINLNMGSIVKVELEGSANTYRGCYGVVDIALHTSRINNVKFGHTPQGYSAKESYDPNTTVELMNDIKAYDSFSGANEQSIMTDDRKNTAEYAHFGGRTFETADGSEHDTGFVLQTGTYMGFGFGDGPSIAIMFCLEPMLVVAAAQEVNCSSVIAFQMMGQFKTLEFDVCSIAGKSSGISKNLKVIGNGEELSAFVVTSGERQHFTVNISGVNDLAFFLEYGEGSTIPFGFFNVMASN